MEVSGPVPKKNVTLVTVVAVVIPKRAIEEPTSKIVQGLKFEVTEALAFVKLPPLGMEGRISSEGGPPPSADIKMVLPETVKVPVPPGGGGPAPTHRSGVPFRYVTVPPAPTLAC
jgi:hypothetical protein